MNPSMTPEQALYQRQLAQSHMGQQNPQVQAQMRQAYMQQQQRMAMAQGQYQQNQHLQPQFQQQRRPSPMGQMPQGQAHMGHPGQQNPMVGYGAMPPPSSGPMGVTMQPGMHPQQQQAFQQQQQMMRNNNAQFPVGMNPQMASMSPHPQGTPSRPPSQMQGTPVGVSGGMTPTNMQQGNMTPTQPQHQAHNMGNVEPMGQPQKSPMGPPSQNGSVSGDKTAQRIDTLLEINNILLKVALDLQAQGKSHQPGGQQSPTTAGANENGTNSPSQPNANAGAMKMSQTMAFVTRPLQANIGYLTGSNQGKRPKWPLLMGLPPTWPATIPEESTKQLQELYAKLRTLFPEYNPNFDPMTGQPKVAPGQMRPPQAQPQPAAGNQGSPLAAAGS